MAAVWGIALLAMAALGPSAAQIAPEYARNVTVYHLNPVTAGAVPVNMDTGDALGDLYFYLGQFLLPLECKNQSKHVRAHFDCDNPEREGNKLVVTKVDMEIDSRSTYYSACNLCNGTDPFTQQPCKVGTYVCDCFASWENKSAHCDPTRVGSESIKDHFAPHQTTPQCKAALTKACASSQSDSKKCSSCVKLHQKGLAAASCVEGDLELFCPSSWGRCNATSPEWMCWGENIPRKTDGTWYSTLEQGLCNNTSPMGSCGWKVLSTQTVKEPCLKNKLITHVESTSPTCFGSCGPRNTNSSCWIGCFFDTLLGKEARHSSEVPLSGLAASELEKAWSDAFLPVEQGGCDLVEIPDFARPSMETLVV